MNFFPLSKYAIRLPPLPSEMISAFNGLGISRSLKIVGLENCSILTLVILSQIVSGRPLMTIDESIVLIICLSLVANIYFVYIKVEDL